jgi:hypothetical protein
MTTLRQRYTQLLAISEQYGEQHALDLTIPCPHRKCTAREAQSCDGQPAGTVHFARRLKRLLMQRTP